MEVAAGSVSGGGASLDVGKRSKKGTRGGQGGKKGDDRQQLPLPPPVKPAATATPKKKPSPAAVDLTGKRGRKCFLCKDTDREEQDCPKFIEWGAKKAASVLTDDHQDEGPPHVGSLGRRKQEACLRGREGAPPLHVGAGHPA